MSTLSPERANSLLQDTQAENMARQLISDSLARVERMDDGEVDRQLESLIMCSRRIGLLKYLDDERIHEFVQTIPDTADLLQKIHDTADTILEHETLDGDSSVVIANLGTAADLTGDAKILNKTLDAIEDTDDLHIAGLAKALSIASTEERLFTDVYKVIKSGGVATTASKIVIAPMSERPNFDSDGSYALLSKPLSETDIEAHTMAYKKQSANIPKDSDGNGVTVEEAEFGLKRNPVNNQIING